MLKGPNALNSLLEVLLRWRTYEVAMVLDLIKAYQSLRTGPQEKHVRRFVWIWGKLEAEWTVYAYNRVTFGDVAAALTLELANKIAAELGVDLDPAAVEVILRSTYVEDTAGGGTEEEVQRYIGEEQEDGSYMGTVPKILGKVGRRPKIIVRSGETDPEKVDKVGKVLAHSWHPQTDTLEFSVTVNLSMQKVKGVPTEPNLTAEDLDKLPDLILTPRKCLSVCMSRFDPLGLLSPITIKWKLAIRRFHGPDSPGWDEEISPEDKAIWVALLEEALQMEPITVPRGVIPPGAEGLPMLVCFMDRSLAAFCFAIYMRYQISNKDED